jgi:HK97 family phage major capsid protein
VLTVIGVDGLQTVAKPPRAIALGADSAHMTDLATRPVSVLPAGTALSRYLVAKALAPDDLRTAIEVASRWRTTPQVRATLELELKAAIAPATTTDATWAAPLAAYGIADEALTLLRGASILGALEGRMRRVPFHTKIARETGTGTGGAWIGEGLSMPVSAGTYDTLTQEAYKAAKDVVLTKELLVISQPSAERTIRESLVRSLAAYLDAQFLDPAVTVSANLRPASITNGAPVIVSTGATAAAISADLAAMNAAITTPGGGLVWIMRKKTMGTIAGALGAVSGLPQTLWGYPVIVSDTSPAQITLADTNAILYSDDGAIELDATTEGSVQMDSAPASPPAETTVFVSLWQTNQWAVKAIKWLAYQRAYPGAVSYMVVAY